MSYIAIANLKLWVQNGLFHTPLSLDGALGVQIGSFHTPR